MPDYSPIIADASKKYGVPADLLQRQLQAESSGDPRAVSSAGARGLMQLMPGTAKDLGVTDPFDPTQSIMGGAAYMAQMYKQFGSWPEALAAYNAGPGNVQKKGAASWPGVRDYVSKVMGMPDLKTTAQQIINDPQRQALLGQAVQSGQQAIVSRETAKAEMTANRSRSQGVLDQITADRANAPAMPTLADVPKQPDEKPRTNPLKIFGEVMPMMAILGSGLSRGGALAAMKTATAAMTAVKARDSEEAKAAHDRWKSEIGRVGAQNELELTRYKNVMDNRKLSMDDRLAELRVIAADSQDAMAIAQLDVGNFDQFTKLIQLREGANTKVFDIIKDVEDNEEKRRERELGERRDAPGLFMGDFVNKLRSGQKPDANEWRILGLQMSGSTADKINYLMLKKEWSGLSGVEQGNLDSLVAMQGRGSASGVDAFEKPLTPAGAQQGGRPGEPAAQTPGRAQAAAPPTIALGQIVDGYRFKGGDWNDANNWEAVR
jgi:hypothetical protein